MIISKGEKVHLTYRALYEDSTRRHFLGEVLAADGAICRLFGYAFVYYPKVGTFQRKPENRITITDLAESGYIVNVISPDVVLANVEYRYERGVGLIATDNKGFVLNINEFGTKV